MLSRALALLAPLLAMILDGQAMGRTAQSPSAPAPLDDEALARLARALAGRLATVELVAQVTRGDRTTAGEEQVLFSRPGVVIGPRHVMTLGATGLRPRALPADGSISGLSLRLTVGDPAGNARSARARMVQSDAQTGLAVLEVEDLRGSVLSFNPSPTLVKDAPVVLAEPVGGRIVLRRGKLLQARAHLDQGKGKNPLILFKLDEPRRPGGRSYSSFDDDLSSGAGAFLADAQGGFLGIVTPPSLAGTEKPGGKSGKDEQPGKDGQHGKDPKDGNHLLKEGEVLALPAEIARFVSDTLARGKLPARGYFGATFGKVDDSPEEARRLGCPRQAVRVEKVYPGGPADQGGLRAGDWLVAVAEKVGITYPEVIQFSELVEYGGQGQAVLLTVARGERRGEAWNLQLLKLKIRIGKRPPPGP